MKTRKPRRKNLSARERDEVEAELQVVAKNHDLSLITLGNFCHALGRGTINVKRKEDQ